MTTMILNNTLHLTVQCATINEVVETPMRLPGHHLRCSKLKDPTLEQTVSLFAFSRYTPFAWRLLCSFAPAPFPPPHSHADMVASVLLLWPRLILPVGCPLLVVECCLV